MTDGTRAIETDPSVCYRHPGRQSWVLCQRCGRTVCPECQILAPVGVHCPECVAETSGGVSWRPTNVAPLKPKRRRAARRTRSLLAGAGSGLPVASRSILGAAIVLFIVGVITPLPFEWLAGVPGLGWQLWRFVTAPFAYPAGVNASILYFALSAVFFWLTAPQLERMLGLQRFLGVFVTASVIGTAGMLLTGLPSFGLTAPLFGLFAALLVEVWQDQQVRTQILVMIGINLLISLLFGGAGLAALVGGMIGGAGFLYLLRTGPDRGWKARTPLLITVGVCFLFVALAVVRGGILV